MSTDLERRRPTRTLIRGTDPRALRRLVAREARRGALTPHTRVTEVARGVWAVEVTRYRPLRRRPGWAVPAGVTVAAGVGLATLGWFLPVPQLGPALLGFLAVLAVLLLVARGSARACCEVIVTVIHRHR